MAHAVAFVDSIATSPSTRLNLNDGSTWTTIDRGTEFPPPPLRRAVVSTLMLDGARIPAAAYDNRTIKLRLNLQAASEDASATQVQALFRELDRPFNILKFQPSSATNPVYFRTFRSDANAVREVLPSGGLREFEVELLAEPFGYGTEQTLSLATVNNDPAAGSNGCYFDATGIDGDVETPAILKFAFADIEDMGPTAIAVRRRGTPSSAPFLLQAESMTGGTNTTIQANDAVMSGAGQNYMQCTFGTASMTTRLTSSTFPSSASTDARGIYRVFLRYRRSSATGPINVQLGWTMGTDTATNREVATALTTQRRWADLGTVQIPIGVDPVYDGFSGTELPARGGVFTVAAERTSGTSNLDFDCLVFMPACDRFALVTWPTSSGPTYGVVDGTTETVYMQGASDEVYTRETASLVGMFPYFTPNQTNRVYVLLNAGGDLAGSSDDKSATPDVTASYYPRYLYVRPATT